MVRGGLLFVCLGQVIIIPAVRTGPRRPDGDRRDEGVHVARRPSVHIHGGGPWEGSVSRSHEYLNLLKSAGLLAKNSQHAMIHEPWGVLKKNEPSCQAYAIIHEAGLAHHNNHHHFCLHIHGLFLGWVGLGLQMTCPHWCL